MKPLIANNQVLVRNQYRALFLKRFDKKVLYLLQIIENFAGNF